MNYFKYFVRKHMFCLRAFLYDKNLFFFFFFGGGGVYILMSITL